MVEQASLLPENYPALVQKIQQLKGQQEPPTLCVLGLKDDDDEVVITTTPMVYEKDTGKDIPDSSPPPPDYVNSSDYDTEDSIRRNADFIAF
jgi:hypothetical protein